MTAKRVLVTGSSGLIGSEAVLLFDSRGYDVCGIDNNGRKGFFGPDGDTAWNLERLKSQTKRFTSYHADLRDAAAMQEISREIKPDHVIHCAAQPAHEYARLQPVVDFHVNVTGTLNLLEACRAHSTEATFVFCSSSKVYGPVNDLPYEELPTRYDLPTPDGKQTRPETSKLPGWSYDGLNEDFPLEPGDGRGVYGTDKAAADLLAQEYGVSFGMRTVCLRGNCMTGPAHAPAQVHGFLAYLARCLVEGRKYQILGHKGKQLRDNIHAADFTAAIYEVCSAPPAPGSVYNIGGGRENSVSILEAIEMLERMYGARLAAEYVDEPRHGDHRVYVSDTSKFRRDYPSWSIRWSIPNICEDLLQGLRSRADT
ncbi:MAG: NAD-dependent epimerase/dehydratase family protein [Deltaproteobacteria bacterium]|nr:NAD-dependent epimerase/dehydratase family protein [Deltaproteobacteria bacterium]